jgi:glutamyl-tRNA reductase
LPITALVSASIGDWECRAPANYSNRRGSNTIKDYRASIEKLRKDAAEAALIRDLATDQAKRKMYDNLHRHFNRLADEVEQAIKPRAAE